MDTEKIKALILEKCSGKNLLVSEIAEDVGLTAKELWPLLNDMERTGEIKSFRNDSMTLYTASRAPAPARNRTSTSTTLTTGTNVSTTECIYKSTKENGTGPRGYNKGGMGEEEKEKINYPANEEDIVSAAREIGYVMSLKEAAKFFSTYAPVDWELPDGRKIKSWKKLLNIWKVMQRPEERANGLKEADRRRKGLPPIDPEEGAYEYYTDMQGRRWRKRFDETDWEFVREGSAGIT